MDATLEVGSFSVVDVMRTDIFTLLPQTPVTTARRIATEKRVDHLLVLDDGVLAGIVCKDDLRSSRANARVADCMSTPVLCVGPETTLKDAADIMVDQGVSCLPVVIGTSLVGMITRAILARMGFVTPRSPARGADTACVACGTRDNVRSRSYLHDVALCGACATHVSRPGPLPPPRSDDAVDDAEHDTRDDSN